jgi:hypothetical protein
MKYMIMLYASQRDYDQMSGQPTDGPAWKPEVVAAMHEFMGAWNQELVESGEFVEARGLAAPARTRRFWSKDGVPVVTDGPYAETQEVLAGYTIVECESLERASEIVAKLSNSPNPNPTGHAPYADLRPIIEGYEELEL